MYIPQGCVATALEEEDMAALQHQYPGHAGAHARLAAEACAGRTTATEHSTNAYSWCRPHVPNTHLRHWLRQQTDISQHADKASTPPMHQHMYNLLAVADRCALISRSHSNHFFCSVWETVLAATWTPKTQQGGRPLSGKVVKLTKPASTLLACAWPLSCPAPAQQHHPRIAGEDSLRTVLRSN